MQPQDAIPQIFQMVWHGPVNNLKASLMNIRLGQFLIAMRYPLLPRGSPFGDPGPHGDLFQIWVPIFSILSLRTREKSVQPPSSVDHLITCDNTN